MTPVIDIHCHPSLKTYFLNVDLFEEHKAPKDFSPCAVLMDLPKMQKGNVQAILASHYLPEINYRRECPNVDWLYGGINFLNPDIIDKLENDYDFNSPFQQTMQIINIFESKINEAKARGFNVDIARNFLQLEEGLNHGKTMILHSIEGSHSLGHSKGSDLHSPDEYISNLVQLKDKGVCLITLAHFFQNDLVPPVNGIPPGIRKFLGVKPRNINLKITPIGETVVAKMFELGIIVDITHCTPEARKRIFEISSNKYPLVFSHVGVESLFRNSELPDEKFMNPSDWEIMKIAECNGVIGIEFNNYWLTGEEERHRFEIENGSAAILKTIKHIYGVTGTYDNISFGSDFDGLTDPPDDIKDPSGYPALIQYLLDNGIPEVSLNKICYENIIRVLRQGWKNQ
ncbi:MAG TPA: membrane dipeptidase [Ignavibacteriaceae bacterium]|nr:membrane dipeptidase [Ignavibacteriaceae bacterium]